MSVEWTEIRKSLMGTGEKSVKLPNVSLPALPRALMDFTKRAEDPKATHTQLASIIETDASLTCELLKFVNSARFALRSKCSTVQQALTLLGLKQTKLLLMSAGAKLAMAARESRLVNIRQFWNTNLERALLAREVAVLLKADADVAFAAGLLQDFMLPILTNEKVNEYARFLEDQAKAPKELAEWEQKTFGWTHSLAAGSLMFDWGFPDDLICAVLLHDRGLSLMVDRELGRTAAAASAVASLIPDALQQTPGGLDLLHKLESIWPAFNLVQTAERIQVAFEALAPNAGHGFSLSRRCAEVAAS